MKPFFIFDFDGVIVDTFNLALTLNQISDPELTADEYQLRFTGNIFDAMKTADRNAEARKNFNFFLYYEPKLLELSPADGIEDVLKEFIERPAIVSSTTNGPIINYLNKNKYEQYFSEILGADIEKAKTVKLERVKNNHPDRRYIFITDTLGDMVEGNKVSVESIGVTWGYHDRKYLERGNPIKIVESPYELLELVKDLQS